MKLIFLGLLLAFLLFTGLWFSENPGTVNINWLGYDIETNPLVLILVVLIAYIAFAFVMNIVEWCVALPSRLRGAGEKRAHKNGLTALTAATEALLAGNGEVALKQAVKAKKLLPDSPLPLFYAAKAAHLKGDEARSKEYLHVLSQNKETTLLGIRGLMTYAAEDNHPQALVDLAEQAFKTRQDVPWVISILFDHALRHDNWDKAMDLHKTMVKHKIYPRDELMRKKALIYVAQAEDYEAQHKTDDALIEAHQAYKICPSDLAVVISYARLSAIKGDNNKAQKVIKAVWSKHPHRNLGDIYVSTLADKTSAERIKIVGALHALNPTHPESLFLLAKAYMKESLWGEARPLLEKLSRTDPTQQVFAALSELELSEYENQEKSNSWLKQEAHAKANNEWNCSACGQFHTQNYVTCPTCQSFDSVVWGRAVQHRKKELLAL